VGHGPRAMRVGKTSGDARTLEAGPLTIFTVDEPSATKPEPEDHPSPSESGTPRTQDILVAQSIRDVNYDMQHHRCQLLARQLTSLGAGTLINLWTSRMLFSKCKELGLRGLPAPPASWPDEAHLLLLETVESAVPRFITNSLPKWRPDGGASIKTYFINYCLYEFKKIYKSFCRREYARERHEVLYDNASPIFDTRSARGPEGLAIARCTVSEAAQLIDSDFDRQIISRTAQEIPQTQIARELGVSVTTIVRRLKAYRRKLDDNGWTAGDGGA
jgi:hypothetical protein